MGYTLLVSSFRRLLLREGRLKFGFLSEIRLPVVLRDAFSAEHLTERNVSGEGLLPAATATAGHDALLP